MVRSMSIGAGAGAGARRPSFQAGSAQANANAMLDPVEAAKMASLAAEDAGAAKEAEQRQLKLSRQVSRGRRMRNAPKRLSTLGESMHERGSIIMKRASILLLGDPKTKKENMGFFSCCMGGGKAAKYEVDPEPKDEKGDSSAEEEDW